MHGAFVPGHFSFEVEAQFDKQPDFKVITFDNGNYPDEPVSYADIFTQGCKLAAALKRAGIGKGDRFSLVMKNHPEFLFSMVAASLTGAGSCLSTRVRKAASSPIR